MDREFGFGCSRIRFGFGPPGGGNQSSRLFERDLGTKLRGSLQQSKYQRSAPVKSCLGGKGLDSLAVSSICPKAVIDCDR